MPYFHKSELEKKKKGTDVMEKKGGGDVPSEQMGVGGEQGSY